MNNNTEARFYEQKFPTIQEVSGVYASPFLNTDELKMNLRRTRNSFRGFGETGSCSIRRQLTRGNEGYIGNDGNIFNLNTRARFPF